MKSGDNIGIMASDVINDTTGALLTATQTVNVNLKDLATSGAVDITGASKSLTWDNTNKCFYLLNSDLSSTPQAGHSYVGQIADSGVGNMRTIPIYIEVENDLTSSDIQTACDAAITANTDINNIDTGVNNIEAKLPTNYIMGSSDRDNHDTDIDAILVDTGTTLPASLTAIETDTQDLQTQIGTAGAGLTDLGGMSTGMKAEVNAEVSDVLKTDTISELVVGAPSATPTFEEAIMLPYMALRNESISTDAQTQIKNDAGTVISQATITESSSQVTRSKFASP